MRLERLSLIAFGPFQDEEIDLSGPGFQIVYGPNEAGKSTALRAIGDLLYGIPERTRDAHSHPNSALCVGAVLSDGDERLTVRRRKRRKSSLRDGDDEPIDEAVMTRWLGGVARPLFEAMFGLNHETLRAGAESLLRGGETGLGESLFDAGGARGIGELLDQLRAEAEEIYKPRGQNPSLNRALRDYREAKKAVQIAGILPSGHALQRRQLEEAVVARDAAREHFVALDQEQRRLQRALRVKPTLTKRAALLAELAELGEVPRLPADARQLRERAEVELAECARVTERLQANRERIERQRAELVIDEKLAALAESTIDDLDARLGRHRAAERDLPKRRAELEANRRDLERKLAELGIATPADLDELRIDRPTQARIRGLMRRQGVIESEEAATTKQVRELMAERDAIRRRHDAHVDAPAPELAGMMARVDARLDARIADLDAQMAGCRARRDGLAQRLGLTRERVEAAVAWTLPATEQHLAASERAQDRLDRAAAELAAAEDELRRVQAELAALDAGAMPTEERLLAARGRRDELLAALLDEPSEVAATAHREATAAADQLADERYRQADRVASHARLQTELARVEATVAARRRAHTVAETGVRENLQQWQASWSALELAPPADPLAFAQQHGELVACTDELNALLAESRTLNDRRDAEREQLAALLGAATGASHADLCDRAAAKLQEQVARDRDRARWSDELTRVAARLEVAELERADKAAAREAWQRDWAEAMARLSLSATATVDEAAAVLDALDEVFDKLGRVTSLERRITKMERDAAQFAEVASAHATVGEGDVAEVVSALLATHDATLKAIARRAELDAMLAELDAELEEAAERRASASDQLAALLQAAGVEDLATFEQVEQRAVAVEEARARLREVEETLFTEGLPIDALGELAADVDVDVGRARLTELSEEREHAEERWRHLVNDVANKQAGMERLEERGGAFGKAFDQQAELARIRKLARRHATLSIGTRLLEREIEIYRQKNQGPIVRRAGELFPQLTLGEYVSLAVDFGRGHSPELRCRGADGSEVDTEGLSDGARDQLYLALRLASLERYGAHAPLLPLVVDDILVHFDEERAAAALGVLQRFAKTTQVLMFTHQARHVELAAALPTDSVRVHHLAGGHRRRAVASAGR